MSPSPLPLASCRPLIAAEARLPPQAILLNQPQRERRAAARWFNVANTVLPAVALLLPVPTRTLLFTLAQILYFILFVCCWLFDFTAHLHRFAPRCPHASRFCATPPLPFSGYLLLTLWTSLIKPQCGTASSGQPSLVTRVWLRRESSSPPCVTLYWDCLTSDRSLVRLYPLPGPQNFAEQYLAPNRCSFKHFFFFFY